MTEITFYRASEQPYGVFSNLYRRRIFFENRWFDTNEHAYQYGKPRKKDVRDWLMAAPSPALLAMAAHGLYRWDIVPGWSRVKIIRMERVLRAKFTQHEDLKQVLLGTGDADLVEEASVNDASARFWGRVKGKGHNTLGRMIMEGRKELRDG